MGRRHKEVGRGFRYAWGMGVKSIAVVVFAWLAVSAAKAQPMGEEQQTTTASTVKVHRVDGAVEVSWSLDQVPDSKRMATLRIVTQPKVLLSMSMSDPAGASRSVFENAAPVYSMRVGQRDLKPNGWTLFFDRVDERPNKVFPVEFGGAVVSTTNTASRATVTVGPAKAGNFEGTLQVTVFAGSPLVLVEAVMSTAEDSRAILYDAGLEIPRESVRRVGFEGVDGKLSLMAAGELAAGPVRTRLRTMVAQTAAATVAVFPPPHQFFYPLDYATNFGCNDYGLSETGVRIGVRQPPHGDGRFRPWVNAPPGTQQRLGLFVRGDAGDAKAAMDRVRAFTHDDRMVEIPGYKTMVSHVHVEHTAEFMRQQRETTDPTAVPWALWNPGWVQAFKARGIQIVHLAEFHAGETPKQNAAERIERLSILHKEARRLSNEDFLVLPGEEPNVHLGGHWISLFPTPVYWVLNRGKDEPFVEETKVGKLYRVGSAADVLKLMEAENGLMWTAHARIKASQGFPDAYMPTEYFKSDHFLGAAWKAMPADYSLDRLGIRVLNLLDDMANKGFKKQAIGEIDLFQLDPTSELYGHMNVNYLQMEKLPKFDDGWNPVLGAIRGGRFFTSTGEVLITHATVGGKGSGETVAGEERSMVHATLAFTFPPAFAEVISGDGEKVYRERVDLSGLAAFANHELNVPVDLRGRKWARLEAWDVAKNGAFTQPVWIEGTP